MPENCMQVPKGPLGSTGEKHCHFTFSYCSTLEEEEHRLGACKAAQQMKMLTSLTSFPAVALADDA